MLKKTYIYALFTAIASSGFASQSLLETYEQAVANDPTLAIERLNAEIAQEDVKSGLSAVLPSVSLSGSYSIGSSYTPAGVNEDEDESIFPDFDTQNIGGSVTVDQNIFALAALTAYDALKANAEVADVQAAYAEQNLIVRVAEAYINVLVAKDQLIVLNAQLEAVERQYEQTEQRYEVGLVAVTDVLDAEATLDETRVSLIRAQSSYDIALQNLSVITGSVPSDIMSISEDIPVDVPAESGMQNWIDYALENHPDIVAAEKGLEVGELSLKALREQNLPSVTGRATFGYNDTLNVENDLESTWSSSLSINISYSLYDGGASSADIASQGISNNISEQNLDLLKRNKEVEVANLYRTVRADAQNIAAQQRALESRQSALQATTVGYEVGTRNIVEVLNAQLNVFNAQTNLNNARYDYLINLLNLKKAVGQVSIADLQSIEDYLIEEEI